MERIILIEYADVQYIVTGSDHQKSLYNSDVMVFFCQVFFNVIYVQFCLHHVKTNLPERLVEIARVAQFLPCCLLPSKAAFQMKWNLMTDLEHFTYSASICVTQIAQESFIPICLIFV